MPCKEGQTRYSVSGKKEIPLTLAQFKERMITGKFVKGSHRAFAVGLYYFGLRKSELRRAFKEQFKVEGSYLVFNVGKRLKHSKETEALKVSVDAPFVDELITQITQALDGKKVFGFSDRTTYNIAHRAGFYYPHYFRLSRITNLFEAGRTITQVKSFTGLSLVALNAYAGKVDILDIGKDLGKTD